MIQNETRLRDEKIRMHIFPNFQGVEQNFRSDISEGVVSLW